VDEAGRQPPLSDKGLSEQDGGISHLRVENLIEDFLDILRYILILIKDFLLVDGAIQ